VRAPWAPTPGRAPQDELAALRLTHPRHAAFVVGVASGKDARTAWVDAGHTDSPNAKKTACKWRHRYAGLIAALAAEVAERTAAAAEATVEALAGQATLEWHTREWVLTQLKENALAAMADKDRSAANTALIALGKELKMFRERTEHTGEDGRPITLEVTVTRRIVRAEDAPA
jgi:hypothetical protein